jgi:hypothetical protein
MSTATATGERGIFDYARAATTTRRPEYHQYTAYTSTPGAHT